MAALDRNYNNCSKIIAACMNKVKALPNIAAEDYEALVSYKICIVNNYTRWRTAGLEKKVSNMDTISIQTSLGASREMEQILQ